MSTVSSFLPSFGAGASYVIGVVVILIIAKLVVMPVKFLYKIVTNSLFGGALLLLINYIGFYWNFNIAITPIVAIITAIMGVPGVVLMFLYHLLIN